MSEATVQSGVQAVIQALAAFENAEVVINDWTVLDGSVVDSQYVIIETSDEFRSVQDTSSEQNFWSLKVTHFEPFSRAGSNGWKDTLDNLRDNRQAIIDTFNAVGDNRAADGLASVTIDTIRNEGDITPYFAPGTDPALWEEEDPIFLFQTYIFEVEEY